MNNTEIELALHPIIAAAAAPATQTHLSAGGMAIALFIIIGLPVILIVWVVLGVVRMFTGNGGGGGGGAVYNNLREGYQQQRQQRIQSEQPMQRQPDYVGALNEIQDMRNRNTSGWSHLSMGQTQARFQGMWEREEQIKRRHGL